LSAGAIQSPQLLMLSGIGDADSLQAMGITPTHNLPSVGKNLQDHLQSRLIYRCTNPSLPTIRSSPDGAWHASACSGFFAAPGPLPPESSWEACLPEPTIPKQRPIYNFISAPSAPI